MSKGEGCVGLGGRGEPTIAEHYCIPGCVKGPSGNPGHSFNPFNHLEEKRVGASGEGEGGERGNRRRQRHREENRERQTESQEKRVQGKITLDVLGVGEGTDLLVGKGRRKEGKSGCLLASGL